MQDDEGTKEGTMWPVIKEFSTGIMVGQMVTVAVPGSRSRLHSRV